MYEGYGCQYVNCINKYLKSFIFIKIENLSCNAWFLNKQEPVDEIDKCCYNWKKSIMYHTRPCYQITNEGLEDKKTCVKKDLCFYKLKNCYVVASEKRLHRVNKNIYNVDNFTKFIHGCDKDFAI
uniref:DUF19 domain-containing protein n=1 Tax=Meloidogyne hapla TaxID=6305 RepID=A0A1I8BVA9_MELHA